MFSAVLVWIEVLILLLREEWLVRVECLDLQEPAVLPLVAAQKIQPCAKSLGLRLLLFALHVLAVDPVLPQLVIVAAQSLGLHSLSIQRLRLDRVLHLPDPRVALLAAMVVPTVVARVIGGAAVLEIVQVVGAQMRVDSMF